VIELKRHVTDFDKMHTFFEFVNYDGWEDFDGLVLILSNLLGCKVREQFDGPYSRHCVFKKDDLIFELMHHDDIGNCLCNMKKQSQNYYDKLESLGREVVAILQSYYQ